MELSTQRQLTESGSGVIPFLDIVRYGEFYEYSKPLILYIAWFIGRLDDKFIQFQNEAIKEMYSKK